MVYSHAGSSDLFLIFGCTEDLQPHVAWPGGVFPGIFSGVVPPDSPD